MCAKPFESMEVSCKPRQVGGGVSPSPLVVVLEELSCLLGNLGAKAFLDRVEIVLLVYVHREILARTDSMQQRLKMK